MTAFALLFLGCGSFIFGREMLLKVAEPAALRKNGTVASLTGIFSVDQVLAAEGVTAVKPLFEPALTAGTHELQKWYICELSENADPDRLMEKLGKTAGVAAVAPNRRFRLCFVPNDSLYPKQYALQKIRAAEAWEIERGRSSVIVAVIDTGVDYAHLDLAENIWRNEAERLNGIDDDGNGFIDDLLGWDFTDAPNYPDGGDYLERDNDPMDEHGHGTAAAGIIAAVTDNSLGISGLAHGCRVMNLRAFTASGYGEEDDVASAVLYAVAHGALIINMSFGDVFVSRLMEDIVRYASAKGVILAASAGNSSTDEIHYPSGFSETISVGATNEDDQLASFSNYGGTVDLTAPGSAIISTSLHGGYSTWNGTSFSAPYVSAAAALLLSQRPNLSPDAVRGLLVNSADDLGAPGWDDRFGAGRLNVLRLLTLPDGALAQIIAPPLDSGLGKEPVDIIGSAWCAMFEGYRLEYGYGLAPKTWKTIAEGRTPVIEGVLARWENPPEQEGEISLRLVVADKRKRKTAAQTRLFVDRSAPRITNITMLPMLDADRRAVLVQFETDDLCEGSLFYRQVGESQFRELLLTYRTRTLRRLLNQEIIEGKIEWKVEARNGSGLKSGDDNGGRFYIADLSLPPIAAGFLTDGGFSLPFGRLLGKSADFNANGRPEMILSAGENGGIGPIKIYEFDGAAPVEVFSTTVPLIPRDVGDADGDGLPELLAGYGINSYLLSGSGAGDFPHQIKVGWLGDNGRQFWASRIADTDRDGLGEIIMRVVQIGTGSSDQWQVLERNSRGEFETVAVLPNPTPGENLNGVPHCEIGDFDGDGRLEILLGDSDGDLYLYENRGDNTFVFTWQDRMPLLDTIDYIAVGDFDGDGISDFAAGSHSDPNLNTEHDYDARHWCYRVYLHEGNDRYRSAAEQRVFGFTSTRSFLSSLTTGDIDDDGRDELFVAAYPNFYIFRLKDEELQPIYHQTDVQTAAVLLEDIDGDGRKELWIGDGKDLRAMNAADESAAPAVPTGLTAKPLDEHRVQLAWRAVEWADAYRLFKGRRPEEMTMLAEISYTGYLDRNVEEDSLYYYAVQTVDRRKPMPTSRLSGAVAARPGRRPQLLSALCESPTAVRLTFSTAMSASIKDAANYRLNMNTRPTSATEGEAGRQAVLSFLSAMPEGRCIIECFGLENRFGVPLDSTKNSAEFRVSAPTAFPFLEKAEYTEGKVQLTFGTEMVVEDLGDTSNYRLNNRAVRAAHPLSRREVMLVPFSEPAAGDTLRVMVRNLRAENGKAIRSGRGDSAVLVVPERESENKEIFVFPNPCIVKLGTEVMTFVGLREGEQLIIMTSEGERVRTLRQENETGRLQWDLTSDRGKRAAAGVYLFRVTGRRVFGKAAIVR